MTAKTSEKKRAYIKMWNARPENKAKRRAYRKAHPEAQRAAQARYLAKPGNKERRNGWAKAWNAKPENLAKRVLYIRTRRAKEKLARALPPPRDWPLAHADKYKPRLLMGSDWRLAA